MSNVNNYSYYEIHKYNAACDTWDELESRFLSDYEVKRLRNAGYRVWSVSV